MNLNVALCDDDNAFCEEISQFLYHLRPDYNIEIYNSGKELVDSGNFYDLIFMDIKMPEINGIKAAEILRKKKHKEYIVFLTYHPEFMQEAFKVNAFRFLSKPPEPEKIREAVWEAEKDIINTSKIEISNNAQTIFIDLKDIICFEAFGDGTYIYTKNEILVSNKPLKYWINKLGNEHFCHVHKSYFIALRYVKSICSNEINMNFMKQPVPVSRRKLSGFKTSISKYIDLNHGF